MSRLAALLLSLLYLPYLYAQKPVSLSTAIDQLEANYQQRAQEEVLEEIDSLLKVSRSQENPALEAELLILRRSIPTWVYQNEKVLADLDRRVFLAKKFNTEPLAGLYESKATFEGRRGNLDAAWLLFDSVSMYLNELKGNEKIRTQAQVYYLKARFLDRVGKLKEAIEMYQKCITEAEKVGYDLKIMDVYLQLGYVHNLVGNLDQSLKSYETSLKYSHKLQDTSYMIFNHVFMAGNYNSEALEQAGLQRQKRLDSAKKHLDIAEKLSISRRDAYVLELLYYEIGQYYTANNSFVEALDYIELCREETTKTNNYETEIPTYYLASDCHYQLGNYQNALDEAMEGIALSNQQSSVNNLKELYQSAERAAEKLGDLSLALSYSRKYIALNDSLMKETMINSINELQTKYETKKKEAEIESLSQKAAIQGLEIQKSNQTIYGGLIFFSLLTLIGYLLYYRQTTAKKRKQIELEQRFLRSQLNPHFISNALVSVQKSLLESDVETAQNYLLTFARLMREILENSRKEFIPLDDELSMLRDYLEINRQRLNSNFEYDLQIDEELDEELDEIPPMFIQPFVENAIEHGLKATRSGKIKIALRKEGNLVKVTVEDNGPGISSGHTSSENKKSLSTSIIQERIKLYNRSLKNKISLMIENIQDSGGHITGTRVKLHIPVR